MSGRGRNRNQSPERRRSRSRSRSGSQDQRRDQPSTSQEPEEDEPQYEPYDFRDSIQKIGDRVAEGYSFDPKTLVLISSFLNDILKNVTLKAKENAQSKNEQTIAYVDVMVAAMDQFGEENKWIERIVTQGQSKLEAFEDRIKNRAAQRAQESDRGGDEEIEEYRDSD